jgi:protein-tyrosine phosphatase
MGLPASPEHLGRILDTLDGALAAGRNVYLHCWGGIGRTGTVVGCYLVRRGLTGGAALARLAEWWRTVPKSGLYPRSPQTNDQVAYVRAWREPAAGP